MTKLKIDGTEIDVEVAADFDSRYIGLSEKSKLDPYEGMLFVWDVEKEHRLIMRNMKFPIDMVFIKENGGISKIYSAELSQDAASATSKYGLEVPYGFCERNAITTGDKVKVIESESGITKSYPLQSINESKAITNDGPVGWGSAEREWADTVITAIEDPENLPSLAFPESTDDGGTITYSEGVGKRRVYVESEEEIPPDATPQRGEQGGTYYETEELTGDREDFDDFVQEHPELVDITERMMESLGPSGAERVLQTVARNSANIDMGVVNSVLSIFASASMGKDLPQECRSCGENQRMQGNFKCPDCHSDCVLVDSVHEAPDDEVVHSNEDCGLYYIDGEIDKTFTRSFDLTESDGSSGQEKLEIRDYYRVWIENAESAPEDANMFHSDSGGPGGADWYYDVPLKTNTVIDISDSVEKTLAKHGEDRSIEFPTKEDIENARLPHYDGEFVDEIEKVIEEDQPLQKSRFGQAPEMMNSISSPLTLLYAHQELSKADDGQYTWHLKQIQEALEMRDITAIDKIEKGRRYIDDPSEAPADVEVQEGPQGGYYYDTGTTAEVGGDEEIDYEGDYEVETAFGTTVAESVEDGNVVQKINAGDWMRQASEIEDEDLLVDALEQIDADGTKTANDRIRSRLGALGWEDSEIDAALREESIDPVDRFDKGDSILLDFGEGGVPATVTNVSDDETWGVVEVQYPDGEYQWLDESDLEIAEVEIEGFDVDRSIMGISVPDPGNSTGVPNDVQTVWEKSSTEELEEYLESGDWFDPEDVYNPLSTVLSQAPDSDGALSPAEEEMAELDDQFHSGKIDSDEGHMRAREIMEDYPEEFVDEVNTEHSQLLKGMLWYRDDSDIGLDEVIDIDVDDRGATGYAKSGFRDSLNKLEPHIGAYALASVQDVELHDRSNRDSAGMHYDSGSIKVGTNYSLDDVKRTAAHEMGHQVHKAIGLNKSFGTYPDSSEWRDFSRDDAVFGIREQDTDEFRDLRKVQKNWERYQDSNQREIRPYQRRHGSEYLAISFAHWSTDESKLKNRDPYMAQYWDVHGGGADKVESPDEIQEGDEIIMSSDNTFATAYEVETVGDADADDWWQLREINARGVSGEIIDEAPQDVEEFFDQGVSP